MAHPNINTPNGTRVRLLYEGLSVPRGTIGTVAGNDGDYSRDREQLMVQVWFPDHGIKSLYAHRYEIVEEEEAPAAPVFDENTPIGTELVVVDRHGSSVPIGATAIFKGHNPDGPWAVVEWTNRDQHPSEDGEPHKQSNGGYRYNMFNIQQGTSMNQMSTNITTDATTSVVSWGKKAIIRPFSPTLALILIDARSGFTAADHEALDTIIGQLRDAKVVLKYVATFREVMDPKARFKQFMDSSVEDAVKMATEFDLGMTAKQIEALRALQDKAKAAMEVAQAAFDAKFTLPSVPYERAPALNIDALYANEADAARAWIADPSVNSTSSLRSKTEYSTANRNLLRKTDTHIQLLSENNRVTISRFTTLATKALAYWAGLNKDNEAGSEQGYGVTISKNFVAIGCQKVPRAEVERIAEQLGMEFPSKPAEL